MTRLLKTTTFFTLGLLVATGACQKEEDDAAGEFRRGVPRQETVELTVGPAAARSQSVATPEVKTQGLMAQGAFSDGFQTTRNVAVTVNTGALFVGVLVKAVTSFPPTAVAVDSATWGPWNEAKDGITWKVTVTRVAANTYDYVFEGRDTTKPTDPFKKILSGQHKPSLDATGTSMEGFGAGSFTIDFTARNTLPNPERRGDRFANVGTMAYVYTHTPEGKTDVEAQFRDVWDDQAARLANLDYEFHSLRTEGGSLDFVYAAPADGLRAAGEVSFRSRWKPTGAGRSDAKTRNAVPAQSWSECWDTGFKSTYFVNTWAPAVTYGTEATDCAFTTAEFSQL